MVRKSLLCALLAVPALAAEKPDPAAAAINAFGVDLLRQEAGGGNSVVSPYSIQLALGMACAGAADGTREQMAKALHYPDAGMNEALAALSGKLDAIAKAANSDTNSPEGGHPIAINIANRLFGQAGFKFKDSYLSLIREQYGAPVETLDFGANPAAAAKTINAWVEKQTRNRIHDLISPGALDASTRLVLANAIYLKAPWADEFEEGSTEPQDFHLAGGKSVKVPTMSQQSALAYAKRDGFTVVALPYANRDLQFLILLPDAPDGLAALEKKLSAGTLAGCAQLPVTQAKLWIPKFKIEPPVLDLNSALQSLGMKSAFNIPPGSADFSGMADLKAGDALYISSVVHKAFLSIDEHGTEAAAATAAVMGITMIMEPPQAQAEVRVDHPFLFAVQHRPSGACLFLGRVTDPR